MLFMKIFIIFYIKAPHSIVGVSAFDRENRGNMFIHNVVMHLLNYAVSKPRSPWYESSLLRNLKSLIDYFLFSVQLVLTNTEYFPNSCHNTQYQYNILNGAFVDVSLNMKGHHVGIIKIGFSKILPDWSPERRSRITISCFFFIQKPNDILFHFACLPKFIP